MANRFVHVESMSNDLEASKRFYKSLFDWKVEDMPEIGYTMIAVALSAPWAATTSATRPARKFTSGPEGVFIAPMTRGSATLDATRAVTAALAAMPSMRSRSTVPVNPIRRIAKV